MNVAPSTCRHPRPTRRRTYSSSWSDNLPRELARYRGSEVKSLGDGFLATFDGPARAVRCARAITEAIRPLEIQVRCGLHTGEIEIAGNDVQGIAVHIASRVSAIAARSWFRER
jgi:class 3 adenylate cyclase